MCIIIYCNLNTNIIVDNFLHISVRRIHTFIINCNCMYNSFCQNNELHTHIYIFFFIVVSTSCVVYFNNIFDCFSINCRISQVSSEKLLSDLK